MHGRYLDFIKDTVYRSPPQAKLGGRPGTYQLVKSFLNIRQIGRNPALVDGLVEGQPIWAMVFYCLRCGDVEDALNAVMKAGYVLNGLYPCWGVQEVTCCKDLVVE